MGKEFEIKDLRLLKYFLGIEVARSKDEILLPQRNYVLDILQDSGMLGCRLCETPIKFNHRLLATKGHRLIDINRY